MVSKNRHNDHCVSLPADWSLPKIHLATRVPATPAFPDATRIQTGLHSLTANPQLIHLCNNPASQ